MAEKNRMEDIRQNGKIYYNISYYLTLWMYLIFFFFFIISLKSSARIVMKLGCGHMLGLRNVSELLHRKQFLRVNTLTKMHFSERAHSEILV